MDWPSPFAKASRISGRPAWFSIVEGSDCESANTCPSALMTVTRTLLAAIFATQPRRTVEASELDGESDEVCGGFPCARLPAGALELHPAILELGHQAPSSLITDGGLLADR